jgi:uncharacterized protein (DUF2252 family)
MSRPMALQYDGGMRKASDPGRPSQARVVLPRAEMERVRVAARAEGLSLAAFLRRAVLTATDEVYRRRKGL